MYKQVRSYKCGCPRAARGRPRMVPWLRTVLLLACVAPHQGEPCAGSPLPYSGLSAANQHPMRAKMPRLDELFAVQRKMADGQKATFVVIGGSMTLGHGLCNGGAKACPEEAWPGKLEPLLGRLRALKFGEAGGSM